MRIGSLCSGIGGLELGLERAGLGHTVWQAEINPDASQVLAAHWPGVPNIGNFVGQDFPSCDVLIGGFPCQPVSTAGTRKGINDERWLFDDICDAVGGMETPPGLLLFENVRGLLTANDGHAMGRVIHGLARLGYVGQYGILRASDIGAPHPRARIFIIATRPETTLDPTGSDGRPEQAPLAGPGPATKPREHPPLDTDVWGPYAYAVARWEQVLGRPAPRVDTGDLLVNPAFVEWMMGFPEGWCAGLPDDAAIRCYGNAVVPQVAEHLGQLVLGQALAVAA